MFAARTLGVLLFAASVAAFSVDDCKNGLREARSALRFMAKNMVQKEHAIHRAKFEEFLKAEFQTENPTFALFSDFDADKPEDCPPANLTIFPTPTAASFASLDEEELVVPSLFRVEPEQDPFVWFISSLHEALSKEEEVCNGPEFTSLASVTEEQVLGLGSAFLARDGKFLCPLCHHVVDHIRPKILGANILIHADDEVMFRNFFSSQLPSTQAICSTALPACYEEYHGDYLLGLPGAFNKSAWGPTLKCASCGVCMTAATVLEHKVLLAEKVLKALHQFLSDVVFYNVCAELCPNPPQMFQKFTFKGCMKTLNGVFDWAATALQRIALPNHLCALELKLCEPNATPNLVHCLPQLCSDNSLGIVGTILQALLGDLCQETGDLPKDFLDKFNIPAKEYEKTLQRMRMFDEL